jgi:hypothetical protein
MVPFNDYFSLALTTPNSLYKIESSTSPFNPYYHTLSCSFYQLSFRKKEAIAKSPATASS